MTAAPAGSGGTRGGASRLQFAFGVDLNHISCFGRLGSRWPQPTFRPALPCDQFKILNCFVDSLQVSTGPEKQLVNIHEIQRREVHLSQWHNIGNLRRGFVGCTG